MDFLCIGAGLGGLAGALRASALGLDTLILEKSGMVGGVTAYSLEEKVKLLGVDRAGAKKVNCVSAEVAEQMARGACALFGADVALATTGYAEPSRADGVAVPFAWWAVAMRGPRGKFLLRHGRVECPSATRVDAQRIVADAALAELVAFLREVRG